MIYTPEEMRDSYFTIKWTGEWPYPVFEPTKEKKMPTMISDKKTGKTKSYSDASWARIVEMRKKAKHMTKNQLVEQLIDAQDLAEQRKASANFWENQNKSLAKEHELNVGLIDHMRLETQRWSSRCDRLVLYLFYTTCVLSVGAVLSTVYLMQHLLTK